MSPGWRTLPRDLWRLTAADFVLRAAYQMGKTPLLPIYAAMLGASEILIGLVVSISTTTGLLLKPLFGLLSDRMGRKLWLMIGLAIFSTVPFLYQLIDSAEELFALRLLHGLATAIFGPVGLAYVAEMGAERRAERIGVFGMARIGGYWIGPIAGAALLTHLPPETVFTIIGFASLLALAPMAFLEDRAPKPRRPLVASLRINLANLRQSTAFWLGAGLETSVHVATYALKAFLPVYALTVGGHNLLLVGAFFSLQELAHLTMRPVGGRLADRLGPATPMQTGLFALAAALLLLPHAQGPAQLLALAAAIGASLAFILPANLSLLTAEAPPEGLGFGMGALGAMRNFGKIAGPVAGGAVVAYSDYATLFSVAALFTLALGLALALVSAGRMRKAG